MSIKRILVVAPEYPVPPDDGHKLRVLNLVKNINDSIKTTWLLFGDKSINENEPAKCKSLGSYCDRIVIIDKKTLKPFILHRKLIKIKNIFFSHKLSIDKPVYSTEMRGQVNKEISSLRYDFVIFSGFKMFLYADHEVLNQIPYLVDVIDSPSALLGSYFRSEKTLSGKIKTFINWYWAKRYELVHFSKCKNMVFVAEGDAATVRKACPLSNVWTISNGVDVDFFTRTISEQSIPGTLLFTGVMSYKPNNDAMFFFIKEIFPLIIAQIKDVRLIIAGRDPLPELLDLTKDNPRIQVTGYVEDMREEFNMAEVYVSPLVSGAGVKNKILEAWAMSLPVVATKISCAGIDIKNGVNLLVADDPATFAEQVCRLLLHKGERQKIAEKGRETVEQLYSWKARSRELLSCVNEVYKAF